MVSFEENLSFNKGSVNLPQNYPISASDNLGKNCNSEVMK